jgi:hypothetical protein
MKEKEKNFFYRQKNNKQKKESPFGFLFSYFADDLIVGERRPVNR